MRRSIFGLLLIVLVFSLASAAHARPPKHLLVVTVTHGFRHDSIPLAEQTLADLAKQDGRFTVDYARTDDDLTQKMSPEGLSHYDGVVFANTTGDLPLPNPQAFVDWVHAGHGFVGIHSASDTFHGFKPYLDMLGGEFDHHGAQAGVSCLVADPHFSATDFLGASLAIPQEEIYHFKNFEDKQIHLLLYLDKDPNDHTSGFFPLAWSRDWGRGRVFYTALGHRQDVWTAPWFQKHLLGGILWSLGLAKGSGKPQPIPVIPEVPSAAVRPRGSELPPGAIVLYDGHDQSAWQSIWKVQDGALVVGGGDLVTKQEFRDFRLHLEFREPSMPDQHGQARGNSGVYLQGRYEIQVLDSYGLTEPGQGDCGAVYNQAAPLVNACKPPLEWQTYDIVFRAARFDAAGHMTEHAHVTVIQNGQIVQNNQEITGPTASALTTDETQPGPVRLQDHGNPVSYRNIWIVPLPAAGADHY